MKRAFIFHGSFSSPGGNWFPWLSKKLEENGYGITMPAFPTPEGQSLSSWMKVIQPYVEKMDSDTILVGHSLGAAFALAVIEKLHQPIAAAYLVSGFTKQIGIPEFDAVNKTFLGRSFNWEKIRANCRSFAVFHSDNDPYVPLSFGKELAANLSAQPIVLHAAGHINAESGFLTFELLLREMRLNKPQ